MCLMWSAIRIENVTLILNNMQLHHYGYITDSIENTVKAFADLGYTAGEVYNDDVQKCQICFLSNGGG